MRNEPLLLAVLVTAAAACDPVEPSTPEPMEPTFQNVVEQVLTPKCTFSQCHSNTTAAATLDLTADLACNELVARPSCLFPSRMRILPGNPDESFLFHKLTGQGLDEVPAGDCGLGSVNVTNQRMPLGASEIDADELALVHAWIAAGAPCTGKPSDPGPAIASITADISAPLAGQIISIAVTLDKAAPAGGQRLTLSTDQSVLSSPTQVIVPASTTSIRFDAYALRPSSRFTLRARTAQSAKEIVLRVGGLEIAEVLSDPTGNDDQLQWIKLRNRGRLDLDLASYQLQVGQDTYDLVTVPLTGVIPSGGCVVIGGPKQVMANGQPTFSQMVNFTPDLPHTGNQAAGFAVFDSNAMLLEGIATPVDTMLVGPTNAAMLLDQSGGIAHPHCGTPETGMSALRIGASTCVAAQMQPNTCF